MKYNVRFLLGMSFLCASLAPEALAQSAALPGAAARAMAMRLPAAERNIGQQWVANLESAGLVNRALPAPYRVAVPLVDFGDSRSQLKLTYGNHGGATESKGVVLFFTMELP